MQLFAEVELDSQETPEGLAPLLLFIGELLISMVQDWFWILEGLRREFGERLVSVAIYGSAARGEAGEETSSRS